MSRRWKVSLVWTLLFLMVLASCGSAPTAAPPTATPSLSPTTKAGESQPTDTSGSPSSPEVLAACDTDAQASALRPELVPDWTAIGVDTCYDLVFDLTSGNQFYSGSAKITFTNPAVTPLEDIMLRTFPNSPVIFGGNLEITSASIDGEDRTREIIPIDTTTIRLPLAAPLEPGRTIVLELQYNGRTPVDFDSNWIYGTFHFSTDQQILLLSNAYPMLALLENDEWQSTPVTAEGDPVTSSTALYRVEVRTPIEWEVAASGAELPRGEGSTIDAHQFVGGPLRDFMLAASPSFEIKDTNRNGISINLWGLPGTGRFWETTQDAARESISLFDETFGELPYNELDIVIAPLQNASGVEYPGLIILGSKLYLDEESTYLIPLVTAHEVSHQWWYAVVGNDVLAHPWMDEALATYSGMFFEKETDPSFYDGLISYYQERVDTYEAANGGQAIGRPVSAFEGDPRGYAIVVYNKGGLFLKALRAEIGAADFDAALNRYYEANLYQIAQPDELLNSFETTCSCSLDEFYAEWGVSP